MSFNNKNKLTCDTCKFRTTNYCNHPHTSTQCASRCCEWEIDSRINDVESGVLNKGRKDPSVQEARIMLDEWKNESISD